MKIPSRFTVAVHTVLAIAYFAHDRKTTSDFIASSVNVNPVEIRRILGSLKKAGLVGVNAGSGGAFLVKELSEITLYDVYEAVDCADEGLFDFHKNPNPNCPVGKNIHALLDKRLGNAQNAMENELKKVTLSSLADELKINQK